MFERGIWYNLNICFLSMVTYMWFQNKQGIKHGNVDLTFVKDFLLSCLPGKKTNEKQQQQQ